MSEKKQNEGFSSIFGFLMTVIGFAVGVGSLWRFPYVCGTNGGSLFIITYVAVIALIGVPLLTAEISMGFVTQKTAREAYQCLKPGSRWYLASYLHILVALLIFCYTVPIYIWVLAYIFRTASGFFEGMDSAQIASSFQALTDDPKTMFLFAVINWAIIALIVSGGVQKGVEKVNKFLLPALAVIMVICIIIGITVEGSEKGFIYMFKPSLKSFSLDSVSAAVGQAFFALGLAMLGSMIFGSYIKDEKANILKQASIVSVSIVAAGLAAGMMIFPMVFAFDLEPGAGTGLTMITLPNVFNYISGGRIIGTLFYVGFYFAALSSAIGIAEAISAVFMDIFSIGRKKAVAAVMILAVIIGSCSILIPGFLDTVDIITSNYLLVISGLAIDIFTAWIWGADNLMNAIHIHNPAVRAWLSLSLKYLCPVALILILISNFI